MTLLEMTLFNTVNDVFQEYSQAVFRPNNALHRLTQGCVACCQHDVVCGTKHKRSSEQFGGSLFVHVCFFFVSRYDSIFHPDTIRSFQSALLGEHESIALY